MHKILFICHGNICRSPMAEFVMQELVRRKGLEDAFEIASCATSREEIGSDIHRGTRRKLTQEGIPFHRRAARQLTREDYDYYDLLVYMDAENLWGIQRILHNDPEGKLHRLLDYAGIDRDVADPWYTGNFEEAYEDIFAGCTALLNQLCKE